MAAKFCINVVQWVANRSCSNQVRAIQNCRLEGLRVWLVSLYCHSTRAFAEIFFCKATDQNSSILSRFCLRKLVLPTCIFLSFNFNILWIIDNSKLSIIHKSRKYGAWGKSQMAAQAVLKINLWYCHLAFVSWTIFFVFKNK